MDRIIIGLTGDSSKGKGAVSEILKGKGFSYFSLSDRIREQATLYKWSHDRKVLQDLGDKLREDFGSDILVRRTIEFPAFKHADLVVVDGIRHPAEIEYLRNVFDAKIIGVDMTDETAFARMKERNRPGDPKTIEEYRASKERERGEPGSSAMQVDKCLQMADLVIWNEGDENHLKMETEEGIHKLGIER